MQLAALGLFVFELGSFPFSQIDRSSEYQHARSQRVGARDANQFVGPGADSVTIAGAIVPEAAGSYGSIDTLRRMAEEGEAWSFVDGAGVVWGSYVITRLSEQRQFLTVDGTPRKVDFTIDLDRVD